MAGGAGLITTASSASRLRWIPGSGGMPRYFTPGSHCSWPTAVWCRPMLYHLPWFRPRLGPVCPAVRPAATSADPAPRPVEGGTAQEICLSWNRGQCAFPPSACPRRHVCTTCGAAQHRAWDCRDTPSDSRFRRWSTRQHRPPVPSSAFGSSSTSGLGR